ncbi:MAG: metal ABC transporter substrate-binding protein [Nocardioides sp.]|uniref:metal ABC transporter substrate-binding protein n=1 Tax=Nocardioides sp. TaxID=35761 RepID=UPI003F055B01
MKFPRRLVSAAVAGCTALALAACGSDSGADPDRSVVAGFYPLAWLSGEVAGDEWEVTNLTAAGGDPHELNIGLGETATLEGAALVVISRGLQPNVDKTVDSVATGDVLDAAEIVGLVPVEDHGMEDDHGDEEHADEHAEEGHEGHDHGDTDPHFWHDPLRMATMADAIGAELGRLDPDHADEYEARAADVRAELEALDTEFTEGLADCERTTVVVSHDAFSYLSRYGLEFAPIAGLSPDAEASPATLGRLQHLITSEGITTVFSERLASGKMAQTLADDLGVASAVLDPIEGLDDDTADEDYLSLMRANLEALRTANGCR